MSFLSCSLTCLFCVTVSLWDCVWIVCAAVYVCTCVSYLCVLRLISRVGVYGGEACVHADYSTAFAGLDRFHSVPFERTYTHIHTRIHTQTTGKKHGFRRQFISSNFILHIAYTSFFFYCQTSFNFNICFFLRHVFKVSDDRSSGQLMDNLIPGPSAGWQGCWAFRVPQKRQIHTDLPGYSPSSQHAMDDWATLGPWSLELTWGSGWK